MSNSIVVALIVTILVFLGAGSAVHGAVVPLAREPGSPEGGSSPPDSVFLAILRADGLAVPYAVYAEGEWTRLSRHGPPARFEVGESVWYGRSLGGDTLVARGLEIVDIEGSDSWYDGDWAIRTDYAADQLVDFTRFGILLTTRVPLLLGSTVDPGSDIARDIKDLATSHFDRLETSAIEHQLTVRPAGLPTRHPLPPSERTTVPVNMLRVTAIQLGTDRTLFHFRARRQYAPWESDTDPTQEWVCYALSDMEGWVLWEVGRYAFRSGDVNLSLCTEYTVERTSVYGAVELSGETYIIAETFGYEGSRRTIFSFTNDTVRAALPD